MNGNEDSAHRQKHWSAHSADIILMATFFHPILPTFRFFQQQTYPHRYPLPPDLTHLPLNSVTHRFSLGSEQPSPGPQWHSRAGGTRRRPGSFPQVTRPSSPGENRGEGRGAAALPALAPWSAVNFRGGTEAAARGAAPAGRAEQCPEPRAPRQRRRPRTSPPRRPRVLRQPPPPAPRLLTKAADKGQRGAARGGGAAAGREPTRRPPAPPPARPARRGPGQPAPPAGAAPGGRRPAAAAERTYLFVLFLAAVPPLRVAAVGGGGRLRGLPIAVVRALVRAAARPRRRGDGLRARRNSLNIHLHLPVHCMARQKQANTFHHPASFLSFAFSLFSFSPAFFPCSPFLPSFLFPPSGGRDTHGSGRPCRTDPAAAILP